MLSGIGYGIIGAAIFRWAICPALNRALKSMLTDHGRKVLYPAVRK